jgi:hypothetical protein
VDFGIDAQSEQADEQLLALHGHRQRRRQRDGGVAAHDQVDLFDIEQLRIDAGHG